MISSRPPFLAAATGGGPRHTPVWFMRQAGRSLPEYRRVRGEGSILDVIKQPDLAAEITLQPVRRYGVDAAVLYSDIDPALVLAGAGPALAATESVLADNAGHPGHIFNLGHGVHPDSDPGILAEIVHRVHVAPAARSVD